MSFGKLAGAFRSLSCQALGKRKSDRRAGQNRFRDGFSIEQLEVRYLLSVTVQLDYRYDTSNFFNTQGKKDLLQAAANAIAGQLNDNLSAITPGGGNSWTATFFDPGTGANQTLSNMTVAANTIVIFVGGRALGGTEAGVGGPGGYSASGVSQAWFDTLDSRGQAGALTPTKTDFGPWGGAISFDTGTNWFFGSTTAGMASNQTDFYSVATHELGHVLGFGTAPSYQRYVSSGSFSGPNAIAEYGHATNVPLSPDTAHWAAGTLDHGLVPSMTPALLDGTRTVFTSLDFAGLKDIGWTVSATTGPFVQTGTTLDVYATATNNAFTFTGGTSTFTVGVNGVTQAFGLASVSVINFHGTAGNDSLTFTGSSGNDSATLQPGTLNVTGTGYTVHGTSLKTIIASGGGGSDLAYLYASTSNDTFIATPTYGRMTGTTFNNYTFGFGTVSAINAFPSSGTHLAALYTSTGNDVFLGTQAYSQLYGASFNNVAIGYPQVSAVNSDATPGVTHSAVLRTSTTNDTFLGMPTYVQLFGTGFNNTAIGYAAVSGVNTDTTPNVVHSALMYGSAGQDIFVGTSTYGTMSGTGFSYTARGFTSLNAVATTGGNDIAYLYGSASNDLFIGTAVYGQLRGATFNNVAIGFANVYMIGAAGNINTAYLYDSSGNDTFYGRTNYGVLYGTGFFNNAIGFGTVVAISANGGTDTINKDGTITYSFIPIGPWN